MAHDLPDDVLQPDHGESVDCFLYDIFAWPPQLAYTGSPPQYTQSYAEHSNSLPIQHYDHDRQDLWDSNGYDPSIPRMLAPNPNNYLTGSIHDNDSSYGYVQGHTTSGSSVNLNYSFSKGSPGQFLPPPSVDASYERSREGSLAEEHTPRSLYSEPSQK